MARAAKRTPVAVEEPPAPKQPGWPADNVTRRKVAELIPYARNARTHSDAQVAQIAGSIREWGWTMPVLVDVEDSIIAGHGRLLAAGLLGLETVPVMVARGWTDAQVRAYRIADNKLALNSGWDNEQLGLELSDLRELDSELDLTGFSRVELDSLLGIGVEDPEGQWNGMPDFDHQDKTAFQSVVLHFKDRDAVEAFAALVGQTITDKTRFLWYPEIEIERYVNKEYTGEP